MHFGITVTKEPGAHLQQPAQPGPQSGRSGLPPTPGKSLSGKVFHVQNFGRHHIPKGAPRLLGNGYLPFPQRSRAVDDG